MKEKYKKVAKKMKFDETEVRMNGWLVYDEFLKTFGETETFSFLGLRVQRSGLGLGGFSLDKIIVVNSTTGFPRGERLWNWFSLNCEIGFQDLENVLNFAKMYIKYGKSVEILISPVCLFNLFFCTADDSSADVFCILFNK